MLKKLIDLFFQYEKLTIYPEDLRTILGYQKRLARNRLDNPDSHAAPAKKYQLIRIYNGQKEKFEYETPCN
jgi:hypothetical protein